MAVNNRVFRQALGSGGDEFGIVLPDRRGDDEGVGIAVGVIGVALGAFALVRLSRLNRAYELLQVAEGRETIVDVMGRTMDEFSDLRDEVMRLESCSNVVANDCCAARKST